MGSPWSLVGVTRLFKDKKVGERASLLRAMYGSTVQYEPSGAGEGSARELLMCGRRNRLMAQNN